MKQLLTILLIVLGTITINAQGFLGCNKSELIETFKRYDMPYTIAEEDEEYIIFESEENGKLWQLLYDKEFDVIYKSFLHIKSNEDLGEFISSYDENYVKISELVWKNYLKEGVLTITLNPASGKYWPYFAFTWAPY